MGRLRMVFRKRNGLVLSAFGVLLTCGATWCQAPATATDTAGKVDAAKIEQVLRGLNRGHGVGQVAVSPDGKRLAWVQGGRSGGEIEVALLEDLSKPTRVTAAAEGAESCMEGDVAWAPDSKSLAFLSSCGSQADQDNVYLSPLDGSAPKQLTELKGYVHELAFSPDGSKVAFLYVEGATRPAGALAAMKPWAGVIGEDGVEIQRVAVARADAATPESPEEATPADLHVYEYDWAPDSKGLAYIAAAPPGENNWWVAKLYTEKLGEKARVILAPEDVAGSLHGLQIALPRWSPDGKTIAFIGGLMSDQGSTGGDVWAISAHGGTPRNLTEGRNATSSWFVWDGEHRIYVDELAGGDSQLVPLTVAGDPAGSGTVNFATPLFSIPGTVGDGRFHMSLSSTAHHDLFVFSASTFANPPEIYAAHKGRPLVSGLRGVDQLTHWNDGLQPEWGRAESLTWTSGPFHVQGWLLFPKDYEKEKKYPLIVEVHGGPAAAVMARWGGGGGLSATAFSALGYFVLLANPRGSYGQGEAFTQANRKDFGYGDLKDILAGLDLVESKFPVDPRRVGLTGWSYGGFMSMFAVTQTHRFKAAVAGAGISDWLSYYGENSIDQWMIPYFGASVYDDPAVYAKSSAIHFIKQVKTPTLVVVGDRDGECPAPQSFEFWHALRDLGVPTRLVVYPNEGHGFVNPAHRTDVMVRALEWFARYMPPEG